MKYLKSASFLSVLNGKKKVPIKNVVRRGVARKILLGGISIFNRRLGNISKKKGGEGGGGLTRKVGKKQKGVDKKVGKKIKRGGRDGGGSVVTLSNFDSCAGKL